MGKFGWSLPPGCTSADIDRAAGITPEAEAEEDFREEMWALFAAHLDEDAWGKVVEFAWKKIGEAYKLGYDQGQADTHLALSQSQE